MEILLKASNAEERSGGILPFRKNIPENLLRHVESIDNLVLSPIIVFET